MAVVLACDPDGGDEFEYVPEFEDAVALAEQHTASGGSTDLSVPGSGPRTDLLGTLPPRCEGDAGCCGDLPAKELDDPVSWNLASGVCLVAGEDVSAVVDLGHGNVVVAGAGDQVVLAPHASLVFGNGGDDVLKVHGGTVIPGAGADFVRVGPGGRAVLHDPCELAPGSVLLGGPGSTLVTPLDLAALFERGVWALGFDTVDVRSHSCLAECREDAVCFAREVVLAFDDEGTPIPVPGDVRPVDPRPAPRPSDEPAEIGPNLAARLEAADPADVVAGIVVETESTVPLPALPRFVAAAPRESPINQAIGAERAALLAELRQDRLAEQAPVVAAVEAAGGVVRDHAPVAGVLVVDLPAGAVLETLDQPVVRRMEIADLTAPPPPPVPGGDAFSMADARGLTGADGLRAFGADGEGYHIGLVENGVSDHPLLEGRIGIREDCQVVADGACVGSSPTDCIDQAAASAGHGTSSAAILVGSDSFGPEDEGVTAGVVDSWRVDAYITVNGNGQCALAGSEALEAGVLAAGAVTDVVVANVQVPPGSSEFAATLALGDQAYALGVPLVAAAGNFGPDPGTVAAPGRAQNTVAVGALLPSLQVANTSGRGPGDVELVKPNLLGPTKLTTACAPEAAGCPPPDYGWVFGGTSAATPFVAGLATLLLHVYDIAGGATEPPELMPGRLYATLTAFAAPVGDDDEALDDAHGAGLVQVGPTPCSRWRWLTLQLPDDGGTASTDLFLGLQGVEDLRLGAWWSNMENGKTTLPPWDVALRLRRGGEVHEAFTPDTNFQRLRIPALDGGTWTLEVATVGSAPFTGRRVHVFVYYRLPDIACTFGIPEVPKP